MMRVMVQWALAGHLAVWMPLSYKEVITEQKAEQFYNCLLRSIPEGRRVLLCIDNPFDGRASFSSLQAKWPHNSKIQLLMAERENRLTMLADPNHDLLLHWFDGASLVILQGFQQTGKYCLQNYQSFYFEESLERRRRILEKSSSCLVNEGIVSESDKLSVTEKILRRYQKANVSLIELIYRTMFELKKVASKPERIKLDWEEWGEIINREFNDVDSDVQLYGVIAAFEIFRIPMKLHLFCKYFEINERKLKNRLRERFVPRHIEPVIYREDNETLRPKHDVIAELFFLFNREKVTVNSLILDLLDVMDENEIEEFLEKIVTTKREVQTGEKYPVGKIAYWDYMERIYSRMQEGNCNLSYEGKVLLCLGFLWTRGQADPLKKANSLVEGVLQNIAPEMEASSRMAKLYTEWGILAAAENKASFAEEKFLAVIKYYPENVPTYTELGRLLSKQDGREGEAEEFLRKAIRIDRDHIQSRTELGRLLSKQKGREDEAEEFLLEVTRIKPKDVQSRTELARLLKRRGKWSEAEKYLRQVIDIDPENIPARTELGRLLSDQKGREDEAEKYLFEAAGIDHKHIQSRTELGRLLSKQGRKDEAENFFLEVIGIAPKDVKARIELGRLLSKQKGRESEVEEFLLEVLEIDGQNRLARRELDRLQSGKKEQEG